MAAQAARNTLEIERGRERAAFFADRSPAPGR